MPICAVDRDGLIWGMGPSEEACEADAQVWLSEAGDPEAMATPLKLHTISVEQARMVESGTVSWAAVQAGPAREVQS